MRFDGLVEMTERSCEAEGLEKLMHLVVRLGELDIAGKCRADGRVSPGIVPRQNVSIARKAACKGRLQGVRSMLLR